MRLPLLQPGEPWPKPPTGRSAIYVFLWRQYGEGLELERGLAFGSTHYSVHLDLRITCRAKGSMYEVEGDDESCLENVCRVYETEEQAVDAVETEVIRRTLLDSATRGR